MKHELKTWPEFFDAIVSGDKTFEVRRDDRGFQVGDELVLYRWQPSPDYGSKGGYESDADGKPYWETIGGKRAEVHVRVTYKLSGGRFGIDVDWCVLGFAVLARHGAATCSAGGARKP